MHELLLKANRYVPAFRKGLSEAGYIEGVEFSCLLLKVFPPQRAGLWRLR